jgi:type III secretory pathway lipoprotein EscJ
MENQTMKNLMKPENEAEANVIKSVLEEHGIYAEIKSFHDTAYDGLFQSQYGWGLIRVSETDFPEARRIIEEWRNASPEKLSWKNKPTDA